MSLKAFHLFFVAASIVLCAVTAVWGVDRYRSTAGGAGELALAVICALLGLTLIVYGLKVYRKFQELGR